MCRLLWAVLLIAPCVDARADALGRARVLRPGRSAVRARAAEVDDASERLEGGNAEPCNVVLTHTNADFDSLAGSVALAKLWNAEQTDVPTVVVMPRGANPALKRFLAYHKHLYPIRGFATIRPTDVRKIGVVDTQSRERLGRAAEWLSTAESVTIFDHHNAGAAAADGAAAAAGAAAGSPVSGDLASSNGVVFSVVEAVGSATTLIIERLRARGVELRDAEATLFALGIRADTGCLTYEHTTVRDAKALVWLMEQGASQQAVAEFGQARMSDQQRAVLTDALSATRISVFNGVKFATVVVNTDSFLTGMSSIAEELLELTACDVALLGVMHRGGGGGRAHYLSVIGRVAPRAVTVDLNAALQPYGGGGHAKAAAASVRMSDDESTDGGVPDPAADAAASAAARARASALLEVVATTLRAQIPAEVRADSIMTTDVVTLTPDQTVDDARAKLLEHQLRGAPVIDAESGKLLGLLKLSDLVKAAQGGRGGGKIKGVVRTNVPTVSPGMPFVELEEFIMERGIGRLPVIEDSGKLVGIITRTDILRHHNLYPSLKPRTFPDEAE